MTRKSRVSAPDAPRLPAVTSEAQMPSGGLSPSNKCSTRPRRGTPLLRCEMPCLPDRALYINSRDGRLHWHERAERVSCARDVMRVATCDVEVMVDASQPVELHWTVYVPDYRAGDWDGIVGGLKPWQDTLVEQAILAGDSPKYVRKGSVEIVVDKARSPKTVLEIYPYGGSACS